MRSLLDLVSFVSGMFDSFVISIFRLSHFALEYSEFTMAEIEHFVDPLDKDHERFDQVKDITLRLLPKDVQSEGRTDISEITIGEAVSSVRLSRW